MDLSHGLPFAHPMQIRAGSYGDLADCALIIITAGAGQKPGKHAWSWSTKTWRSTARSSHGLPAGTGRPSFWWVSNPVDVLTYAAWRLSGYPAERVLGSGTVLDTARLKYLLGEHLQVDSRSVHAVIIGEHGDSELAVWSGANISGVPLEHFCELRGHYDHAAADAWLRREVRESAYEIIRRKGATYYGVAMAVGRIALAIVRDEHSVLPVSNLLRGQYGIRELCMSVPAIVGRTGVETTLEIPAFQARSRRR